MLIRFTVENFRSFQQETTFSMLPGRMQKHPEHIIANHVTDIDALRVAVIYGANASGKSNLVRAMDFARSFIVEGRRPKQSIAVEPFRLDPERVSRPSRFEFEFAAGGKVFAYGFVADRQRVYEEWLYTVTTKDEKFLFERETNADNVARVKFADTVVTPDAPLEFLNFVARSVRPNQLLLTKMVDDNVGQFETIYNWFHDVLTIIYPDSLAQSIQLGVYKDQRFSQALAAFLKAMGTGVEEVCANPIDPETIGFPEKLIDKLDAFEPPNGGNNGDETGKIMALNRPTGRYLLLRDKAGELQAYVLSTRRYVQDRPVDFELKEESDGTQRLIDLFPILYGAEQRVFVIDELERSLHPNLLRHFIRYFLQSGSQNQLIVTTHESTLLDLTLLRRDEIWFVEKSPAGASTAYSLEAFKPRHDLDIRKGYLHGRFGAIPILGSSLIPDREGA